MRTPPNIPHESFTTVLSVAYGFDLKSLQFWPHGEASYGFVASGFESTLFLKVLDPDLATHGIAIEHLDQVVSLTQALADVSLHVGRPIETADGEPYTKIDQFTLIAFEYLDGETLGEKPWSPDHYDGLGRSVGLLHSLTERLASLTPVRNGIAIPTRDELCDLFDRIDAAGRSPRAARRKLSEVTAPLRTEALRHHEVMTGLSEDVQATRSDWVLCHTDLTGGNLIACDGSCFIIDWEGACIAPREFDLAFFADQPYEDRYGRFLSEYACATNVGELNADTFIFRMYQRNFEDFVEGSCFVLEQDTSDEELDHALDVVLNDSVFDWAHFSQGARKHRDLTATWTRQRAV